MLKIRTRGGAPSGLRRRGRSARSVAAILSTSLLAPAAVAAVATTAVSTLQAAPAAAAPRAYVVSGDAPSRTGNGTGAWGFHGCPTGAPVGCADDYSELRSLITNATNFGPSGTVNATFTIGSPITTITDAALAGVDVYFSGAVAGSDGSAQSYTAPEREALRAFVQRGGILIINQNSNDWNTGQVIGEADGNSVNQQNPPAFFSPTSADDGGSPGLAGGYEAPYKPTATSDETEGAGRPVAGAPLIAGPFGTVTSYSLWHTVAGFAGTPSQGLPTGAVINARVQSVCDISLTTCANPTTPPQPPPGSPTCDADPSPTLPDCPREFNNNLGNLPSLATLAPGSSLTGLGGVVLTSDVDTYSNHSEYNGGVMKTGNRILALNTFAWAAGILNTNNPDTPSTAAGYTSLSTPVRILSTRDGKGVSAGLVAGGTARTIQVAGANGIPSNATAVALNLTASDADNATFVSVYPQGQYTLADADHRPKTSNLNVEANQEIANMVMVKLPANGQLSFYNNSGNVHIYADVAGYYAPGGDLFNALDQPDRVLDTRAANETFEQGESAEVQIRGAGANKVPANATAVVLNVTAATNTARGFLAAFPGDATTLPEVSTLNFKPGEITPNMAVVKLSPEGTIGIYNLAGRTDVIVDVFGYFVPSTATGSAFTPLDPSRMTDTRSLTRIQPGGELVMSAVNRNGIPATGVSAILINVTAIAPTEQTFITVYPEAPRPATSNLNPRAGVVAVPGLVVARPGTDGRIHLFNNNGQIDLAVDVMGYFSN